MAQYNVPLYIITNKVYGEALKRTEIPRKWSIIPTRYESLPPYAASQYAML